MRRHKEDSEEGASTSCQLKHISTPGKGRSAVEAIDYSVLAFNELTHSKTKEGYWQTYRLYG